MPVLAARYTKCKLTPDGKYLLPDNVDAVPVLQSNMDVMATYYATFEEWYKSTSTSINAEVSAGMSWGLFSGSIHGSYSKRHQETKQSFYRTKSSMLHTKLNHHAYTLIADVTAGLHPGFERRLQDVADSLTKNLTQRARYQMEMIVRDYGTHVAYKV
ncbi:hypothetical protein AAVH_11547 [Aphelenchoides avenae]|nr:hypothetical protein AAVH_11547 [Aphelenchus avenae]